MDGAAQGSVALAAVVVTYNRLAQLKVTLARLLESPGHLLGAVVVVDNASTDGTADWLARQRDPRLTVVRSAENRGGAGGFETGLRLAAARLDPDWIVVMDDDARPEPGALAAFAAANRSGWDALAAAVRLPGGRICDMNRPVLNPFWHAGVFLRTALGGGRAAFHLGDGAYAPGAGMRRVDGASFVGLFLSRGAIARAGFPDGRLFVYAEDGLYTLGLSRAGGRIGFAPGIGFEHDCSTFAGGAFRPLWKAYYYHRNLLMLYRRAAGVWFWPALAVIVPKWLAKARHQRGARRAYLRLLARALADGLTGRTGRSHAGVLALAGETPAAPRPASDAAAGEPAAEFRRGPLRG